MHVSNESILKEKGGVPKNLAFAMGLFSRVSDGEEFLDDIVRQGFHFT